MRIRILALALAAAGAVAGCGGDDKETTKTVPVKETPVATETEVATATPKLSNADVAAAANAICKRYSEEGQKLGSPELSNAKATADYFDRARALAQEQQDELDDLNDRAGGALDDLTSATAKAVTLLGDLSDSARNGSSGLDTEVVQRLTSISEKVDRASRAVGADACSS
jgi:hypothetical protein